MKSNNNISGQFLSKVFLVLLIGIASISISCDESFEPREENTSYFYSMYGYLDATADTQWLRITPVREDFDPTRDPIDATVTIRNVDTGEEAVMNDSLFSPNPLVVMWNFWTTMTIEPEATYEITATRSDGMSSSTRTTIPPDFPTPIYYVYNGEEVMIVRDVKNVADVQAIWHVRDTFFNREYIFNFSHIQDSLFSPFGFSNEILFRLDANRDIGLIARQFPDTGFEVLNRQVFIASAGPQWINLYTVDDNIYTLAEGVSNIDDGVGFLLGTITKTVPWQACFRERNGAIEYAACELEKRIR
ncbi:MAG: DUF4249 family protein [Balneolaceae bacterium]|nr:DUF4249 family protein [Balneolaceae bacterium]